MDKKRKLWKKLEKMSAGSAEKNIEKKKTLQKNQQNSGTRIRQRYIENTDCKESQTQKKQGKNNEKRK